MIPWMSVATAWLAPPAAVPAVRLASPVMQMRDQMRDTRASAQRRSVAPWGQQGSVWPTNNFRENDASSTEAMPVQGGALQTHTDFVGESKQIVLGTDGRPIEAELEVWQGPNNTPRRMRVYSEDGYLRPFRSNDVASRGQNTMAVRNTGPLEFPLSANVVYDPRLAQGPSAGAVPKSGTTIQGGASEYFSFDWSVESVEVFIWSEGRNLEARVELLQGPNSVRQAVEFEEDYGYDRPFSCVLDTPGQGSSVRIVNTGSIAFPIIASVIPRSVSQDGGYGA